MTPTTGQLHKSDDKPFYDTPTLVNTATKGQELSIFNLPTELFTVDGHPGDDDGMAPPLPEAPENELYRVTHEIGAGGYGAIWYGVQNTLKRRVALKSLKTESTDAPAFERMSRLFRQEALTTAYLQHPNVVPVYDLASDKTGRPIVVMKLVEGRQWNRVLAEDFDSLTALEFLERQLPVLISVAQAVAFAHSHGIIHRDLKPSQVMIGSYGEVLLMDWGLAMAARDADNQIFCDPAIIVDSQSPLLKPLMPAGTPGYMAPEQTVKDMSRLGPWTDVYLLGAILYELLTGYRPHSNSDSADPLKGARDNNIMKPEICTPERDIPGQLSQLAMKAMSTRPSDRVSSASTFAQELKDYLVKAGRRGESMSLVTEVANSVITEEHSYAHLQLCMDKLDRALAQWPDNQMARYLRHQVLATFARTALANHDLKFARLQAERLHLCHERSNVLAEVDAAERDFRSRDERMVKANARALAERERAETLVRFLLVDLQTELRSVGRADLVHKVATEALQFFDSLTDEETTETTLHNRCIAYLQIGNVLSEQGRRAEAEAAYNRALELTETLLGMAPKRKWKKLQAQCLDYLGQLHYIMGRMELAQSDLQRALEVRHAELHDTDEDPEAQPLFAHTMHYLALVHWRNQELTEAEEMVSESIAIARKFQAAVPSNVEFQSDMATFLATLSNIYRSQGRLNDAMMMTYEALAMRIALQEQFPGNASRVEDVVWVRANLGLLQFLNGDLEGAVDNLRHDLSARRRMYEEDTSNVLRTMGLTFQLSLLAEANFLLHKLEESERLLSECLVHSRRLSQLDDANPTAVSRHALHLVQMGELLATRNQWAEVSRISDQAVERARYSYWLSPRNSAVFRPLVQALALAARVAARQGKTTDAQQLLYEANDVLSLIQHNHDHSEYLSIKARLQMLHPHPGTEDIILSNLRAARRLDPYMKAWAAEIGIYMGHWAPEHAEKN